MQNPHFILNEGKFYFSRKEYFLLGLHYSLIQLHNRTPAILLVVHEAPYQVTQNVHHIGSASVFDGEILLEYT